MPTLRIHFPEKEAPSTIVLKGPRITVGRRPDNTIQILDRTISARHAELIAEPGGHYRLHDLESTNGTAVNGEPVTDYHLTDACKVSFGTLECEFSAEMAPAEESEPLPTRAELDSLRKLNAELHGNIDVMREEIEALKRTVAAGSGDELAEAFRAELQRIVLECGGLRETEHRLMDDVTRLKIELALVRRDRENLQGAVRANMAEIERLKSLDSKVAPVASKASAPPEAAAPAPTPVPAPTRAPESVQKPPTGVISPLKPFPAASRPAIPAPSAPSMAPANGAPAPALAITAAPKPNAPTLKPFVPRPAATPALPVAKTHPVGPSGTQRIGLVPPAGSASKAGLPRPSTPNWPKTVKPAEPVQPNPGE